MSDPQASPAGWASITALAEMKGRDKAAISRRVKRFVEAGLLRARPGPNGTKLINVEEFERVVAANGDAVNEANGLRAVAPRYGDVAPSTPVTAMLSRQQARRASYDADLKKLQRDKLLGELAPVRDLAADAAMHAENLKRIIDRLADRTDDLAAVVAKEGVHGLRIALKAIAREWRNALAEAFAALANPTVAPIAEVEKAEPEEDEAAA